MSKYKNYLIRMDVLVGGKITDKEAGRIMRRIHDKVKVRVTKKYAIKNVSTRVRRLVD